MEDELQKRIRKQNGGRGENPLDNAPAWIKENKWVGAFLWARKIWANKAYRHYVIIVILLFPFGVCAYNLKQLSAIYNTIFHKKSVTVRLVHFDENTGMVTLLFNNEVPQPIRIKQLYFAVEPPNSKSMKPLPREFQEKLSLFDKIAVIVPVGAAIEATFTNSNLLKPILRLAASLIKDGELVILPTNTTLTNFYTKSSVLSGIYNQYTEGSELKLMLHLCLVDLKDRLCEKEIELGTYTIGKQYSKWKKAPYPADVDVLLGANIFKNDEERISCAVAGSGKSSIPLNPHSYRRQFMENPAPCEMLLKLNNYGPTASVPIVYKRLVAQFDRMTLEYISDYKDMALSNMDAIDFTRDGGKTLVNIRNALYIDMAEAIPSCYIQNKEYSMSLSTNWQIHSSARNISIKRSEMWFVVTNECWMKWFSVSDVSTSLITNKFGISTNSFQSDPSWIRITENSFRLLTNGCLVIDDPYSLFLAPPKPK